jgi:hypothetical protein
VNPKFVSPADPVARWTGAHGGQVFFAYSANYLIDPDHAVSWAYAPHSSRATLRSFMN